jgi:hypothetical protein
MFTIEVPKKTSSDEVDVETLEMSHQECEGGALTVEVFQRWRNTLMKITCQKCNDWCLVIHGAGTTGRIGRTALDGKTRTIASHPASLNPHKITVVQKQ